MGRGMRTRLAWLAGLLDGEGSIGISIYTLKDGRINVKAAVQMSITHKRTMEVAIALIHDLGLTAWGYTYQEKKPKKHKPSHHLRVNRLADIQTLARALLPYSVTKRLQWQLISEYCVERLEGVELDAQGRMVRGGTRKKPYTLRDLSLIDALGYANRRGNEEVGRVDGQGKARQRQGKNPRTVCTA